MAKRRARKTKTRPATRTKPHWRLRVPRLPALSWRVVRGSGIGLTWIAVTGGIVIAWIVGVPKLSAFAAQRHSVPAHDVVIRFVDPPQLPADLSNALMKTASLQIDGDPLKRDDLAAVRQSLLETGWFDSIRQVRRIADDLIEIDAHFVRPYTVVRDSDGDHLVDADGKLLPMKFEKGSRPDVIAITGAHFPRPQRLGMRWEGADVTAGINLLRLINSKQWRKQVVEIDVKGYLSDGPIRLKTDSGCWIIWGGAPGEEPALEVLAEGKLHRLDFLFASHGRIDGGNAGELDITGEKAVVTR